MLALRECEIANGSMPDLRIEPATLDDLSELTEMLHDLFTQEAAFTPDREKQLRGLRLILEQPSRGRIFVIRNERMIVGMINLLITISTADMSTMRQSIWARLRVCQSIFITDSWVSETTPRAHGPRCWGLQCVRSAAYLQTATFEASTPLHSACLEM